MVKGIGKDYLKVYNVNEVQKRRPGRPKGSKNKRRNLSVATVRDICDYHKFNPAEKLIAIANGTDDTEDWSKDDRLRATSKLFDAIHGAKSLPGNQLDESNGTQYEIVFVEGADGFQLPGEAGTAGIASDVQSEPLQRAGMSSADGEDSIRGQLVNP